LEPLPKNCIVSTTWAEAGKIGFSFVPILAPIFFGQKSIKGSMLDADFVNEMATIAKKHGKQADMMVEFYSQLEESISKVIFFVDCLKNPRQNDLQPETFTSPGFKTSKFPEPPYTFIYQFSNPDKWRLD
jgi:hypothetical protein